MGCCASSHSADSVAQPVTSSNPLVFGNKPSQAVGDATILADRRIRFGIIFPESTGVKAAHMFFDSTKPVEKMISGAAAHGGFSVDKGKLVGSPERLNLFTLSGDVVRLDLEIDAHLGSTLHAGDTLILEKGNRLSDERLQSVRAKLPR
jgi:hypothetical protein